MDEKENNWQLKMLEDELRERELKPRKAGLFENVTMPQAIIFASIILVLGGWTGKLVYDEIQARRIAAALNQFGQELSRSFPTYTTPRVSTPRISMEERIQQQQAQARKAQEQRAEEQRIANAQARKERLLKSDNCQFWLRMDEQQSTSRTRSKRKEACG